MTREPGREFLVNRFRAGDILSRRRIDRMSKRESRLIRFATGDHFCVADTLFLLLNRVQRHPQPAGVGELGAKASASR
jgi:hypothetical protein